MRSAWRWAMVGAWAWAAMGCDEPVSSNRPNQLMVACCDAARANIALAKDMETELFERRCEACRQGKSRRECASGAQKIYRTVKTAAGQGLMPL